MPTCTRCKKEKEEAEFCRSRDKRCKDCINEIHREWRKRNPETVKAIADRRDKDKRRERDKARMQDPEWRRRKNEWQNARYHKKRSQGLCSYCSELSVPGKSKCALHLQVASRIVFRKVSERKAQRLCTRCGEPAVTTMYCESCRTKVNEGGKTRRIKQHEMVFSHYGSKCSCCGELELNFLTIDHINGDGKQHRMAKGRDSYNALVREFRETGIWPEGYRILCYNCNSGRWRNGGKCPHEEARNI